MKKKTFVKPAPNFLNDQNVAAIFGNRVYYGTLSPEEEARRHLMKSARSDYGRVIDIRIPHGYHEQVKKCWEMYETDRLFRYLVDRCEDFAASGFEWEIPIQTKLNFLERLKNKIMKEQTQEEKEHEVWNRWSAIINRRVSNVIPGIDEINKWIVKQLLLSAMAPLQWEWGTITVNKIDYEFPIRMTIHNPISIALDREKSTFVNEEMYLKLSPEQKKIVESQKDTTTVSLYSIVTKSRDWMKIPIMGREARAKSEGFAIKYKWTPGDNTALVYGRNVHVGQGLYPTPAFVALFETLIKRRALSAADIAILDGVINFILDWEIGDNTKIQDKNGNEYLPNQPRPAKYDASGAKIEKSSIENAKEIITSDTRGNVMQLFHPYYFKLNIKMPDPAVLLNPAKYIQTTLEVYEAFGILMSPTGKGGDLGGVNIQNFEQMLENLRLMYIKRFWESLAEEIILRNKGKLSAVPNMIFKPLNTKTEAFRNGLLSLLKMGKLSSETLLQGFGLDKKVEIQRIAQEIFSGEKALMDAQVPVSFVQAKVKPAKIESITEETEEEETSILTPLEQTGRPKEK